MNVKYFETYVQDMRKLCLDTVNAEIVRQLYATVVIAEIAKKIMLFGGYNERECSYKSIIPILTDLGYTGDIDNLQVVLNNRTDIIHLLEYVKAANVTGYMTEDTYSRLFDELLVVFKFIRKVRKGKVLQEVPINDDFITSLLKINNTVCRAGQEVAATSDTITITKEQLNKIKKYLPSAVYNEIFNNE